MRKLVTIRTVTGISPIEGADAIELAHIDGWQCVAKKGEFKHGDLGVYFEIDSFLPIEDTRFAFLMARGTSRFEGGVGHKLKSIKLRGQLSQGY
jgi:RNA ligase (TIGR02306 family)